MAQKFFIRPAAAGDLKPVYKLSNEPLVRQYSLNKGAIPWDTHVTWFNRRITNTHYPFYILEDENGRFISQVRFEPDGNKTVISISITPEFRARGLAAAIITACVEKSPFARVTAFVYAANKASVKAFERAGFKKIHEGADTLWEYEYVK